MIKLNHFSTASASTGQQAAPSNGRFNDAMLEQNLRQAYSTGDMFAAKQIKENAITRGLSAAVIDEADRRAKNAMSAEQANVNAEINRTTPADIQQQMGGPLNQTGTTLPTAPTPAPAQTQSGTGASGGGGGWGLKHIDPAAQAKRIKDAGLEAKNWIYENAKSALSGDEGDDELRRRSERGDYTKEEFDARRFKGGKGAQAHDVMGGFAAAFQGAAGMAPTVQSSKAMYGNYINDRIDRLSKSLDSNAANDVAALRDIKTGALQGAANSMMSAAQVENQGELTNVNIDNVVANMAAAAGIGRQDMYQKIADINGISMQEFMRLPTEQKMKMMENTGKAMVAMNTGFIPDSLESYLNTVFQGLASGLGNLPFFMLGKAFSSEQGKTFKVEEDGKKPKSFLKRFDRCE